MKAWKDFLVPTGKFGICVFRLLSFNLIQFYKYIWDCATNTEEVGQDLAEICEMKLKHTKHRLYQGTL